MKSMLGSLAVLLLGATVYAQFPDRPPVRGESIDDLLRQGLRLGIDALRDELRDNDRPRPKPPLPKSKYDYQGEQVWSIYDAAGRLVQELEYALHDITNESRQRPQLYQQGDLALREAIHFRNSLQPSSGRQNLYRDFQRLDQNVHELLDRLRASNDASLERSASRIGYADAQLHHALSYGDNSDERGRDLLIRQARMLEQEARQFAQIARQVLVNRDRPLLNDIGRFVDEANHLNETLNKGAPRQHVVRDFSMLDETWHRIVPGLRNSSAYLLRQADRVNAVHNQLHQLLGVGSKQTVIDYRFDQ